MCYDVAYMTQKQEVYRERYKVEIQRPESLKVYHTSGFDHFDLPVITGEDPGILQFYGWGLIPRWVKDPLQAEKISNQTLNARGEEMFSKPSYRDSARSRRCIIVVDAFYEHHHKDGKTYPYIIRPVGQPTFSLGGLWQEWKHRDLVRRTCSIVTTGGNHLLTEIHNNPKLKGPRMPLILHQEQEHDWINPDLDPELVGDMIKPFPEEGMEAYSVGRLRGKVAGNTNRSDIWDKVRYPELEDSQQNLF